MVNNIVMSLLTLWAAQYQVYMPWEREMFSQKNVKLQFYQTKELQNKKKERKKQKTLRPYIRLNNKG